MINEPILNDNDKIYIQHKDISSLYFNEDNWYKYFKTDKKNLIKFRDDLIK